MPSEAASSYAEKYEAWQDECQQYTSRVVQRSVRQMLKGFDTDDGKQILDAEAAHHEGGQ